MMIRGQRTYYICTRPLNRHTRRLYAPGQVLSVATKHTMGGREALFILEGAQVQPCIANVPQEPSE